MLCFVGCKGRWGLFVTWEGTWQLRTFLAVGLSYVWIRRRVVGYGSFGGGDLGDYDWLGELVGSLASSFAC